MTLTEIRKQAIEPAFALLPAQMNSPEALVMLLAIGSQESRFRHRRQVGGPARGFWQFERGGGVAGVLSHPSSREHARRICISRGIEPVAQAVYEWLERDDVLAAAFARLLLWTDPQPLPAVNDADGSWQLYLRTWRPGKPHRHTWDALHEAAMEEVCTCVT